MITIAATNEEIDRRVHRCCAPLFGTGILLSGGHDPSVTSATATFVKFESRIYVVTCHHVLSAFFSATVRGKRVIVPTLHCGNTIYPLATYASDGTYTSLFKSCREFPGAGDVDSDDALDALDRANADRPDIAIADITELWPMLRNLRDAEAIDLDAWVEPDWTTVQTTWIAFGFPDAHKYQAGDKVVAPMPRVSVSLATSFPTPEKPTYILCSTLESDHGWGFSGMSGGPVLVAHATDDTFAFVGITFEGAPSTKELSENSEAFVQKNDIVLKGYHLTPKQFGSWLSQVKYRVEHGASSID
ncbi:hypothetical protein C1922_18755 [Stenotrophomonas sp. ZAC14D2_NAIMI4_7]|uniref:hypothetical protein n=1 Tax=Stenotrophomonas sp. ZAC14D2_NAIMI4_7 TaxID=2072405 RepID=UPI000D541549|nr:hypothetical protein [Stenotrophomonas sp. ZAC14D2_NAIMI4_7]AWH19207.1 hypothetical protein C1922_18755 [Stenotrophomonas sp. ZAC14D2_NAIMI4_7]